MKPQPNQSAGWVHKDLSLLGESYSENKVLAIGVYATLTVAMFKLDLHSQQRVLADSDSPCLYRKEASRNDNFTPHQRSHPCRLQKQGSCEMCFSFTQLWAEQTQKKYI